MIDAGTIAPERRFRDLDRAMRSVSANALLAVVACRSIERRMDIGVRHAIEGRHAAV